MKFKKKVILAAAAGILLSLGCLPGGLESRKPIRTLDRPGSGEKAREQVLLAELDGKKYPLSFSLLEIPMEEEEIQKRLLEASERLEGMFLKQNQDTQHITSELWMPSVIPDTQITVQWHLDSWDYVNPDGTLKNGRLTEPAAVKVQAELELQGEKEIWNREIKICPPENPDGEQKVKLLEYELRSAQEESREKELLLPQSVMGQPVIWYPEADNRFLWMLMLTGATVCAVVLGQRKEEERLQKQRERKMHMDYPEIVNRLSLYMGAGISSRNAWERIVESYEKQVREKGKQREAYEEMRMTLHEMQSGVAEALAYERFGTRCRLLPYLKLGTLLSQNLRRGTKDLAKLLEWEAREAFENRKAYARKTGEECESRLLLPMILMLLTILIMVMYPAIISFQM